MDTANQFLGTERVGKLMGKYAVPCVISLLVGALYNIVDQIFIANASYLGSYGNAANTVVFPLTVVALAIAVLVGDGCCAFVSICLGRGELQKARRSVGNAVILAVVASLALIAVYLIFADAIIAMFGGTVNADTFRYAQEYFFYISLGIPFYMFGQAMNPIIRADGNPRFAMVSTLAGAVINIILDPVFIFGFHMGVRGAAVATVISQAVSCFWVLSFLSGKRAVIRLRPNNMKLSASVILPCILLGLSPFIMQATESIIAVCFNASLQTYGGDTAVGAMTILTTVMQFSMLPLMGLSQGAQPIISFNFGARSAARVKKAFQLLLIVSVAYSAALWAAAMLAPQALVSIFTHDPVLSQAAVYAMRIYMGVSVVFGVQIACQQTFIAIGNAKTSLFLAVLRKIILLIPLIYIMPMLLPDPVTAVFSAEPVADAIAVATTAVLFAVQFRRAMKRLAEPEGTLPQEPKGAPAQ